MLYTSVLVSVKDEAMKIGNGSSAFRDQLIRLAGNINVRNQASEYGGYFEDASEQEKQVIFANAEECIAESGYSDYLHIDTHQYDVEL